MKTISAVRLVCAAALLAALLMLAGCARRADVCDVLAAALGSAPDRPEGTVYSTSAESGSPCALDSELAAVLWGNGSPPPAFALVNSAAVFLPTGQVAFEAAVLECTSTDSASDVALMCCERGEALGRAAGDSGAEVSVAIYGRYVVALLCRSPETVQKAAGAAVRKG